MNKPEYSNPLLASLANTFSKCMQTAEAKNADYAGDKDPFANIKNSLVVGVNPDRAILVRMMDKISRISNLLDKEGQVKDESIMDTISDAINYFGILKAYKEIEKQNIINFEVQSVSEPVSKADSKLLPYVNMYVTLSADEHYDMFKALQDIGKFSRGLHFKQVDWKDIREHYTKHMDSPKKKMSAGQQWDKIKGVGALKHVQWGFLSDAEVDVLYNFYFPSQDAPDELPIL